MLRHSVLDGSKDQPLPNIDTLFYSTLLIDNLVHTTTQLLDLDPNNIAVT